MRRRILKAQEIKRLPDGYNELKCITGTGGQYLNTDIYPKVGDALEITFFSDVSNDALRPFGAYTPGVALDGYQGMRIFTKDSYAVSANIGNGKKSTVKCTSDGTWSLDGVTVATGLPIQDNNSISISIFKARNRNGNLYGSGDMTLYGFKYYRSGVIIADYVPCKEIMTGLIGVYDLVSRTFIGNAGTGSFTI